MRAAHVKNWIALMEGVDGTCGILTTNSSKEVMCIALQQLLTSNHIHCSDQFLSTSLPPRETLDQMITELRSYMIYVDPPKTLFAKVRLPPAARTISTTARPPPFILAASAHVHGEDGRPQRRRCDRAPAGGVVDADLHT